MSMAPPRHPMSVLRAQRAVGAGLAAAASAGHATSLRRQDLRYDAAFRDRAPHYLGAKRRPRKAGGRKGRPYGTERTTMGFREARRRAEARRECRGSS